MINKPNVKTKNNCFSSGPCSKRPGWSCDIFKNACLGRSHRSKEGKSLLKEVINLQREILGIPEDYVLGIIPGSDTGAIEIAIWNLIGKIGVDVIVFDAFSKKWSNDIKQTLKINDYREFFADYGKFPDLSNLDSSRDTIFVYNGTSSGVMFNNLDIIDDNRTGLTICDATSAAFAVPIDFKKIDVLTYSWQKVLGGEAGHGVIVMSPRALERLENFEPENRPIPELFNLKKKGKINYEIFDGSTINTPSMLCVEDAKDSLLWAKSIGGLAGLIERTNKNSDYLYNFIDNNKYLKPLCDDRKHCSKTSVCFTIKDEYFGDILEEDKKALIKDICKSLSDEKVAYDIAGYKSAPASFRVWCGPTIELDDIKILCDWFNYILDLKFKK